MAVKTMLIVMTWVVVKVMVMVMVRMVVMVVEGLSRERRGY